MKSMIFTIAGFLLLLALNGCATAPAGSGQRQELLATDTAFSQMSQAHGAAEAFYAFMSPDATSLPAGETPVHGREAIRQSMSNVKGSLSWHPVDAEVAASGDLGYTWGLFEYQSKDATGQSKVSHGKYVTVWKRQPDGSWKAVLDCGNPSPPPR